ncbi:hypothetical protein IWW55_006748, partial [Coemansia sp. RSA 2706]
MDDIDWFSYFLHPESLQHDFGPQSSTPRWATPAERRLAGVHVLKGLLGANNFREFVLSAYPALGDLHGQHLEQYSGPTPPSTPLSPAGGYAGAADSGNLQRIGQCSRFTMAPET